jgi:signal peptidase
MNEKVNINIIKKILKISAKVLWNLFMILCVFLILIIILQRVTDSNNSFVGYRIFRVITGSMSPDYEVGEVVICKEVNIENLNEGQTIVYRGSSGELNGKFIMHNIVEKYTDNGELYFRTKGTQNAESDSQVVSRSQILGLVIFKAKLLTWLYKIATNTYSAFIVIFLLAINVFISFKKGNEKGIAKLRETNKTEKIEEDIEFEQLEEDNEEIKKEIEQNQETEKLLNKRTQNRNSEDKITKNKPTKESSEKYKEPEEKTTRSKEIKEPSEKHKEVKEKITRKKTVRGKEIKESAINEKVTNEKVTKEKTTRDIAKKQSNKK